MRSFYTCKGRQNKVWEDAGVNIAFIDPFKDSPQQQGLLSSLIAKVVNNLQVTVKNIHVRYEDKLSVPGVRFLHSICCAILTVRAAPFRSWSHARWVHCCVCERSLASCIHR